MRDLVRDSPAVQRLGRVDPDGLWGPQVRSLLVSLSAPPHRPGGRRETIREICETRVRYGYRRVHVLLRRDGWEINMTKTRRIYYELGLQLRNKHPKRRVKAKLREDRREAAGPNEVWAMDFVHDQLATDRKLRILTVIDTHSRYCPAADPRFAFVVQTLERVCRQIGYPGTIRVDVCRRCAPPPATRLR